MTTRTITYTHWGWYWICPILFGGLGKDCPDVEARWSWLDWLFDLCAALDAVAQGIRESSDLDYEAEFRFSLIELKTPILREVEIE